MGSLAPGTQEKAHAADRELALRASARRAPTSREGARRLGRAQSREDRCERGTSPGQHAGRGTARRPRAAHRARCGTTARCSHRPSAPTRPPRSSERCSKRPGPSASSNGDRTPDRAAPVARRAAEPEDLGELARRQSAHGDGTSGPRGRRGTRAHSRGAGSRDRGVRECGTPSPESGQRMWESPRLDERVRVRDLGHREEPAQSAGLPRSCCGRPRASDDRGPQGAKHGVHRKNGAGRSDGSKQGELRRSVRNSRRGERESRDTNESKEQSQVPSQASVPCAKLERFGSEFLRGRIETMDRDDLRRRHPKPPASRRPRDALIHRDLDVAGRVDLCRSRWS